MPPSLFPLVVWDPVENAEADARLTEWNHWLGPCQRPFGRQSFALWLAGAVVCVAVSASTVNATCGGWARREVVELARLCSHPQHRDLTRVALRLWRVTAAGWPYWPVKVLVSYANAVRHRGDIYRLDGWTKVCDVRGGTAGGNWSRAKKYDAKSVWAYPLDEADRERLRANAKAR